ncbi:MAG: 30S ribosomal protein S21 [Planctomycetota bacterium]
MVKIFVKNGENVEKALKRFKRNCNNAGILRDTRKLTQYDKPTAVRRKAKRERLKSLRRLQQARLTG